MGSMLRVKLGDVALVEISGVDKKTTEGEASVRLCNFTDVYKNWAITSSMHDSFMVASANEREIAKFSLHRGQVAVTKDSETRDDIGIPTYIADNFDDVILGYHCALITPDETQLNGKYLNAFLHTEFIHKFFSANASGSGQRYTLSIETLNSIPIYLPSLEEQERIGNIFSSIDRKIELNRQINDYLEAMAQQLYDYWFVQFDFPDEQGKPYKSSGGKMVWNERLKREIPEGWECATLQDFLTIKNGRDHKALNEGLFPVYGSGGLMRYVDSYLYNGESVLFPRKGSLNHIMYVNEAFWTVDTMFFTELKIPQAAKYIFYSVNGIDFTGLDSGTGVPSMTSKTLYSIKVIKPTQDLLQLFDERILPWLHAIESNRRAIEESKKLRDELLPLLMNGQVSVRQAAK